MKLADINRNYGRAPRTRGYTKVCKKLRLTSGWKLRSQLGTLQDSAQTNVGAMLSHMEKQEWELALICYEDLADDVKKMRDAIASTASSNGSQDGRASEGDRT